MMSLLKGRQGPIVDLGSGDGRIVIEAAKRGIPAEGVELNPWLVLYSRYATALVDNFFQSSFILHPVTSSSCK